MRSEYIAIDAMKGWLSSEYARDETNRDLLTIIIEEGKVLYLCDAMFPQMDDTLKIGYSGSQLQWCSQNEFNIWAHFVDKELLVETQYKGKEHFKPIYKILLAKVNSFGADIEVSPKKAWVSLRRKKQFAMLIPATKTRFEIGLNLKGYDTAASSMLKASKNSMCSHVIELGSADEITKEVVKMMKAAYELAD